MEEYIKRSALVAEIENIKSIEFNEGNSSDAYACMALDMVKDAIDNLEVKDPYEQCVQYDSIKAGIQAHAETYSFNIESQLFPQLTKGQQALWKKEIEQACISGGDAGVTLARDQHYKENLEVKEVVDAEIIEVEDNNNSMYAYTHLEICTDEDLSKICKAGDKAKVIIIKQK